MATTKKKSARDRSRPEAETFTISDLEQMKVLADPLRIRILGALSDEARTTKQVAELLGEKPTKLYHHVEALERVGVIRLSRTRRNRGTLEKYYQAVARRFTAASHLLTAADEAGQSEESKGLQTVVSTMLDSTAAELRQLIASGEAQEGIEDKGILCFCEIIASEKELKQIRGRFLELLEELTATTSKKPRPTDSHYRLTLALFPLFSRQSGPDS